eukprot:GDKJ01013002.1.p1 GENE.GDKJ01013002.1~~GDKJ01013002.1.p1  ORF type:complete len:440 (-),score=105.88 GDKJ01013002.1:56-1288(-)
MKNMRLVVGPGELETRDIALEYLENCEIIVLDSAGAVRASRLKNCKLIFAAVGSSALLYFLENCEITVSSRQLRVHDSNDVIFHVCTRSFPVIERSRRISFLPYNISGIKNGENTSYLTELWESSTLETPDEEKILKGPWKDVKDFDWIKMEQSPHWNLECSRVEDRKIYDVKKDENNKLIINEISLDAKGKDFVLLSSKTETNFESHESEIICERQFRSLSALSENETMNISLLLPMKRRNADVYVNDSIFKTTEEWEALVAARSTSEGNFGVPHQTANLTANPQKAAKPILTIEQARKQALDRVLAMSVEVSEDQNKNQPSKSSTVTTVASSNVDKSNNSVLIKDKAASVVTLPSETEIKTTGKPIQTAIASTPIIQNSASKYEIDSQDKKEENPQATPAVEEWPDEF